LQNHHGFVTSWFFFAYKGECFWEGKKGPEEKPQRKSREKLLSGLREKNQKNSVQSLEEKR